MTGIRRPHVRAAAAGAVVALSLVLAPMAATYPATASPATPSAPVVPEIPLPDGQSDQPAPASREKRVIGNVHTDTVSSFLDDGRLVLASKADVDVTGDGVPDLGSRFDPAEILFHLGENGNGVDSGRVSAPGVPGYEFLGEAGEPIWIAPQTQDARLIWPGFSTEHPSMTGRVRGDRVDVRLTDVVGRGDLEMYLASVTGPQRAYSSVDDLADWSLTVPQHQHMNWVFDAPGTYTLTFEMSADIDGRTQTAANDYTFVVGDLAAHTVETTTALRAGSATVDPGDPVLLTAAVTPEAGGAVQFRDLSTGSVLGHTPVVDGDASFRADALTPGEHRIVAEFVPTWSTDATASRSDEIVVTVTGDALPRPVDDDTAPVPDAELDARAPGVEVVVTTTDRTVAPGGTLTARVAADELAGDWVSAWLPGDGPSWRGWVQVDLDGGFTVDTGTALAAGEHRLVVKNRLGALVGWDAFRVSAPANGGSDPVGPPPDPAPEPPAPPAQAPPQVCEAPLTLDRGHIDAFYVSAANGRAVLQLMEDVTGHRVIREPEHTLLRVKASAYRAIPGGLPGAPAGFVLPLTQDPALIWPGWDTNRTSASGYTDVSITVANVSGPGRVSLSSQGSFGGVTSLLTHGGYALPGTIREEVPAHTHAQWVFSEAGIYTLSVYAVATNPGTGDALRTATRTYTFQVGDVPLGDALCGLRPVGVAESEAVNAAVNRAAAEAVAAAQLDADAAAVADAADAARERAERSGGSDAEAAEPVDTAAGPMPAGLIVGVVAGGVLLVGGIVGLTVWFVRRLGAASIDGSAS